MSLLVLLMLPALVSPVSMLTTVATLILHDVIGPTMPSDVVAAISCVTSTTVTTTTSRSATLVTATSVLAVT
jgi:hypothetical protein